MAISERFIRAREMPGWDWDLVYANSRPGQRLCLEKLRKVFTETDQRTFTAILPMGYGKSHLMRAMGMGLIRDKVAIASFVVAPGETLVDQMVEPDNLSEFQRVFRTGFLPDARRLVTQEANPIANGEHLRAMTQQWLVQNLDWMKRFVRWCVAEFGAPPVFLIDECHNTSEANKWGNAVIELLDAGALMVLVTATAYRTDKELIPGFKAVAIGTEEVERSRVRYDVEREQFLRDHMVGTKKWLRLSADFEYPLQEAINEKPSPIGMITRVPIDIDLWDDSGDSKLSEQSPSEARKRIGEWVNSELVIRACIGEMLRWLRRWHERGIQVGALVFCTNDRKGSNSGNSRTIERVIHELAPQLSVAIATMAESANGTSAAARDRIKRFAGTKGTAGAGDVLLVKQMGGQGLDSARIKIVVDLSSTRTPNSLIQRIGRCNRPFGELRSGLYITPDDVISREIFDLWITDEGGSVPVYELETLWSEVIDFEDDRNEDTQARIVFVQGTSLGEMQDVLNRTADVDSRPRIDAMLDEFPFLLDSCSPPQLAAMATRFVLSEQPQQPAPIARERTTAEQIQDYRTSINGAIQAFLRDAPDKPYGASKEVFNRWYSQRIVSVWNTVKADAGVDLGLDIKKVTDLDKLAAIADAVSRLRWGTSSHAAD